MKADELNEIIAMNTNRRNTSPEKINTVHSLYKISSNVVNIKVLSSNNSIGLDIKTESRACLSPKSDPITTQGNVSPFTKDEYCNTDANKNINISKKKSDKVCCNLI